MDLNEKVVVITGATGEIGRATVEAFLREGSYLALLDYNYDALVEISEQLGLNQVSSLLIKVDITSETEVKNAFRQVVDAVWMLRLSLLIFQVHSNTRGKFQIIYYLKLSVVEKRKLIS
jgi:NAD(P)-dependent dehydrogenase (short-subunit alcohol dehydrogenase family)